MKGSNVRIVVCVMLIPWFVMSATADAFDQASLDRLLAEKQCPECDLRDASLSNADLSGAYLIGAVLINANLSGANLFVPA